MKDKKKLFDQEKVAIVYMGMAEKNEKTANDLEKAGDKKSLVDRESVLCKCVKYYGGAKDRFFNICLSFKQANCDVDNETAKLLKRCRKNYLHCKKKINEINKRIGTIVLY